MSTTRVGFQYTVLRCVPRVEREEFVNVGVVLYSQAAEFLCAASEVNPARLQALCTEIDIESVRSALSSIEAVCRGDANAGVAASTSLSQRFGWLAAPKSTVVQPGPIHGGVTDDPARQLVHLLDELVH
jgi:hypothetical protein